MFLISKLYLYGILDALLMTLMLEVLSMVLQRIKNVKLYFVLIVTNIFTNVLMNFALYYIPRSYYNLVLVLFEISVVFIEGLIFNLLIKNYKKSFRISFIT